MYVSHLKIDNFRNIDSAELDFSAYYNILTGKNAQGKTNAIESIFMSLTGKSHRENITENFIGESGSEAKIQTEVVFDDQSTYRVVLTIGQEKKITINEDPVKRRSELLRNFSVVLFSPQDLDLVQGGPKVRRSFLDEVIMAIMPKYASILSEYTKAITQKNAILREYTPSCESLLDVYDESILKYGSSVIKYRIHFLKDFYRYLSKYHQQITEEKENLELTYSSNIFANETKIDVVSLFRKALIEMRQKEIDARHSLVGPHHDDVPLFLDKRNARHFASQGQQRSIALCMKLALIDMLYEKNKERPIILLDDVMSELDDKRQEMVIKVLDQVQSFITCTGGGFIDKCRPKKLYFVENGQLSES